MFGWQFLDNGSTNSEEVYCFGICIQGLQFLLCTMLDIFALWPRKTGAKVRFYAFRGWLVAVFSIFSSMHYINGWCRIVFAVNSPMRVDARQCTNVFGTSDCKHYIRQSLWDEWRREWRRVLHCLTIWWTFLFNMPASWWRRLSRSYRCLPFASIEVWQLPIYHPRR